MFSKIYTYICIWTGNMLISWASQLLRRSCECRWVGGDCMPPAAPGAAGRLELEAGQSGDTTHRSACLHPSGHNTAASAAQVRRESRPPSRLPPHMVGGRESPHQISIARWASSVRIKMWITCLSKYAFAGEWGKTMTNCLCISFSRSKITSLE